MSRGMLQDSDCQLYWGVDLPPHSKVNTHFSLSMQSGLSQASYHYQQDHTQLRWWDETPAEDHSCAYCRALLLLLLILLLTLPLRTAPGLSCQCFPPPSLLHLPLPALLADPTMYLKPPCLLFSATVSSLYMLACIMWPFSFKFTLQTPRKDNVLPCMFATPYLAYLSFVKQLHICCSCFLTFHQLPSPQTPSSRYC
jgi:hypothetical protein